MKEHDGAGLRLFGPIEAGGQAKQVDFVGRLARLLAALVDAETKPVSRDLLMEWVWDEEEKRLEPRLSELMCQLRRRFEIAGIEAKIVCEHGLCRLDVAASRVDVHEFDRLVAAGREAAAMGATEKAAEMLRQALELRRGEPLGALDGVLVQGYRMRLKKAYLNAQIAYAEILVGLNRHVEALPVLDELHRAEPRQQKVAELCMLARYRSGDRVRAAEVFPQVRRALVDVGMDVGKSLSDLHQRILEQDHTLDPTLSRIEQRSGHEMPDPGDTVKRTEKSYTTGDKLAFGEESIAAEFVVLGQPGSAAPASLPTPDALRAADQVVTGKKAGIGRGAVTTEYAIDNRPPR